MHVDIHPANILVASDGSIKIIDYGFACYTGSEPEVGGPGRADINYFSEPEYAKAILAGLSAPMPTMQGEQFSLAALLYALLTGAQYLKFPLERDAVLQYIVTASVLPFSAWSIPPWFEVEGLLATALSKEPADRFPSLSVFVHKLQEIAIQDDQPALLLTQHATAAQELLHNVLRRLGPEGPGLHSGLTVAPTCSLANGAAGMAYALYRIACAQDNASLLSLADIWSMKAINTIKSSTAFYNGEDITPEIIGNISPYHTASGVYCVQACISHALGDLVSLQEAVSAFITASKGPCDHRDLIFGRAGTLLASSFLLDRMLQHEVLDAAPLLSLGDGVMQSIWDEVNAFPALQECSAITYLGMAHGWAGLLYATMCWCQSSDSMLPDTLEERLQQLADCGESSGTGMRWRWELPQPGQTQAGFYMSGWCNGSAGYVHLWTLAHRLFGNEQYSRLAEQAAWYTWEEKSTQSSLCCGLAGQAYALLNLYKHIGERAWLTRAQALAHQAALNAGTSALHTTALHSSLQSRGESLYYGDLGIAVLAAELVRSEEACMPFFEREGWQPTLPHKRAASVKKLTYGV
jgi:serine/threonine-protein kinase